MSALIALLLLAGAAWFVLGTAGRGRVGREPMDSVHEFARAMQALDPTASPRPALPARPRAGAPRRR